MHKEIGNTHCNKHDYGQTTDEKIFHLLANMLKGRKLYQWYVHGHVKKGPRMPEFRILGTQRTKFGVLRSGIQGFCEPWNSDDGGSCGLELRGPRFWKDIPHKYFCSGFEYIHISSRAKTAICNMQCRTGCTITTGFHNTMNTFTGCDTLCNKIDHAFYHKPH